VAYSIISGIAGRERAADKTTQCTRLVCDHVIAEDEQIDILEKQVDQDGVSLLIRFHPVASDMRQVISAMKVSTNLERVGDQSVTIARRAKRLNSRPAVGEVALLEPAYHMAVYVDRKRSRRIDRPDVVAVMTPDDSHYKICPAALDAGFHIICDKPLANDLGRLWTSCAKSKQRVLSSAYTPLRWVRDGATSSRDGGLGSDWPNPAGSSPICPGISRFR
jgi:hypothetical protein